jgi:long-chain acyl-CoA synthetase
VLVDAGCHAYSMISVPLYDTLGPDAVEYICSHADLAAVACSIDVLPTLLGCVASCPTVKLVVSCPLQSPRVQIESFNWAIKRPLYIQ